jgi:hypothetical protein
VKTGRGLLPDCYGVGVLETEWRQPAHTKALSKLTRDLAVHLSRIVCRSLSQNRQQPGPGVLRVHVDLVGPKRLECDLRSPETGPTLNPEPTSFQQLGKDFREEIRLAERFGGDDDRTHGGRRRALRNDAAGGEQQLKDYSSDHGISSCERARSSRT